MRAGGLRHPIAIQALTETTDEYKARIKTWTTMINTRADVLHRDGKAEMKNNEIFTSYTVDFRIRSYHKVKEDMRVLYNGVLYAIEAILPSDVKQMQTLKAVKVND